VKSSIARWNRECPCEWGGFDPLLKCGLVWAFGWWGPYTRNDQIRIMMGPVLGKEGVFPFSQHEERRWMVQGLRVAFPGLTKRAAIAAVAGFLGEDPETCLKHVYDNRSPWSDRKPLVNEGEASIRGHGHWPIWKKDLPAEYPYDPLPLWPASPVGRVVDLIVVDLQKAWIKTADGRFRPHHQIRLKGDMESGNARLSLSQTVLSDGMPPHFPRGAEPSSLDWEVWEGWMHERGYSTLPWRDREHPIRTIPVESHRMGHCVGAEPPETADRLRSLFEIRRLTGNEFPELKGREHLAPPTDSCL